MPGKESSAFPAHGSVREADRGTQSGIGLDADEEGYQPCNQRRVDHTDESEGTSITIAQSASNEQDHSDCDSGTQQDQKKQALNDARVAAVGFACRENPVGDGEDGRPRNDDRPSEDLHIARNLRSSLPQQRFAFLTSIISRQRACLSPPCALSAFACSGPVAAASKRRPHRTSPAGSAPSFLFQGSGHTYTRRMDRPLIMNLADAPAVTHPSRATQITFEPGDISWPDTGVNVQVMQPGQPNCRYHREPVQEDFLVLYGECIVILGGEERALRQWDFVHCPAGTDHVFVGAGNGPSAVLMIGSRREDAAHYPVNDVAAKYDASVTEATDDPGQAYADWRQEPRRSASNPWPLGD